MRKKTAKGSKRRVGKRSGEEDLWQKEQHVQNHETGKNSLVLSRSKRGSVPAGEGVGAEPPGGAVGDVLGPAWCEAMDEVFC